MTPSVVHEQSSLCFTLFLTLHYLPTPTALKHQMNGINQNPYIDLFFSGEVFILLGTKWLFYGEGPMGRVSLDRLGKTLSKSKVTLLLLLLHFATKMGLWMGLLYQIKKKGAYTIILNPREKGFPLTYGLSTHTF